jgi:hypothetical protein
VACGQQFLTTVHMGLTRAVMILFHFSIFPFFHFSKFQSRAKNDDPCKPHTTPTRRSGVGCPLVSGEETPCMRAGYRLIMSHQDQRASGESWDSRSSSSVYWGKSSAKVKMCPHVKPGGGQCGLTAQFCMCMCLLCGSPMSARKRCGAWMKDGGRCPWGQDRSPEVSTPEQSPPKVPIPRKRRCPDSAAPGSPLPVSQAVQHLAAAHPGDRKTPLINFVTITPGRNDPPRPQTPKRVRGRNPKKIPTKEPRYSLDSTPASTPPPKVSADIPVPRPPTSWTRTLSFAASKLDAATQQW